MHFKQINFKVNYTLMKLLKDFKSTNKILHTKKILSPNGFTGELCQTFKEEIIPSQHKTFHDLGRGEHFPTQFMRALLPWYQNQENILQEKKNTDQYPS